MKRAAYKRYKPSGFAQPTEIPSGWSIRRGRYVYQVNPDNPQARSLDPVDEVSFVPMESVGEYGGLTLDKTKPLDEIGSGYTGFQDGDVVVAKITPCFENGKGALAARLQNGLAYGTTELHVIRAGVEADHRFLFYLSISQVFRALGESEMYGAGGQKRVPTEFLKDFGVPLPSLEDQNHIVGFLDAKTAQIDALIDKKRSLIETLKEKRIALISRVVARGLPPEAARAVGLDSNPSMKTTGIEWIPEVPSHWEVHRLKWSSTGCQNGIWGDEPDEIDDVVCVRVADFDRTRFVVVDHPPTLRAVDSAHRRSRLLKKDDLLLEKSGGGEKQLVGCVVQFTGEYPAVCSNFVARLGLADGFHGRFLAYLHSAIYAGRMNYPAIKQTTGIQNLDSSDYLDIVCAFPALHEQKAISAYLDNQGNLVSEMLFKVESMIDRLTEYRQSLITAAVTGKIDVRRIAA